MKRLSIFLVWSSLFWSSLSQAVENPLFGATHLLPSPFTLPAGTFFVGSVTGVGITDFLQLQTDLIADFYQIYNATARLSLLDFPGFAAGISLGYQYVNLVNLFPTNPDFGLSSFMPGAVVGFEILPQVAAFLGGNLFYANRDISDAGISTSGYLRGAQIEGDVSWAYNPHQNRMGNVLSAGITYNTTFNFYGFGVSHHWRGFQLGVHYFPNATSPKVIPIIGVGAVFEI